MYQLLNRQRHYRAGNERGARARRDESGPAGCEMYAVLRIAPGTQLREDISGQRERDRVLHHVLTTSESE